MLAETLCELSDISLIRVIKPCFIFFLIFVIFVHEDFYRLIRILISRVSISISELLIAICLVKNLPSCLE